MEIRAWIDLGCIARLGEFDSKPCMEGSLGWCWEKGFL